MDNALDINVSVTQKESSKYIYNSLKNQTSVKYQNN